MNSLVFFEKVSKYIPHSLRKKDDGYVDAISEVMWNRSGNPEPLFIYDGKQNQDVKGSFKIRAYDFLKYLEIINVLQDEVGFRISKEGWQCMVVDPAHISMIVATLPFQSFDKYKIKRSGIIGINIFKLIKTIKNLENKTRLKRTILQLDFVEDDGFGHLKITVNFPPVNKSKRPFKSFKQAVEKFRPDFSKKISNPLYITQALLDISNITFPRTPNFSFDAVIKLRPREFFPIIKSKKADTIIFSAYKNKIGAVICSDDDKEVEMLGKYIKRDTKVFRKTPVHSGFANDYLLKLFKKQNAYEFKEVYFLLGEQLPLFVIFNSNGMRFKFLLAPRIRTDDEKFMNDFKRIAESIVIEDDDPLLTFFNNIQHDGFMGNIIKGEVYVGFLRIKKKKNADAFEMFYGQEKVATDIAPLSSALRSRFYSTTAEITGVYDAGDLSGNRKLIKENAEALLKNLATTITDKSYLNRNITKKIAMRHILADNDLMTETVGKGKASIKRAKLSYYLKYINAHPRIKLDWNGKKYNLILHRSPSKKPKRKDAIEIPNIVMGKTYYVSGIQFQKVGKMPKHNPATATIPYESPFYEDREFEYIFYEIRNEVDLIDENNNITDETIKYIVTKLFPYFENYDEDYYEETPPSPEDLEIPEPPEVIEEIPEETPEVTEEEREIIEDVKQEIEQEIHIDEETFKKYVKLPFETDLKDIIVFQPDAHELDTFDSPSIRCVGNTFDAKLKMKAVQSHYPPYYDKSLGRYVDIFSKMVSGMDFITNMSIPFEKKDLVRSIVDYDMGLELSPEFLSSIGQRMNFLSIQQAPYEQWINKVQSGHNWELIRKQQSMELKHPKVWEAYLDMFKKMQNHPSYIVYMDFYGKEGNWLKYLFDFQKHDVIRMAIKKSCINAFEMGLGKTRTAIAVAELKRKMKGIKKILIVCKSKLINTWQTEFRNLGMKQPLLLEYIEDLDHIKNNVFSIISEDILASPPDKRKLTKQAKTLRERQKLWAVLSEYAPELLEGEIFKGEKGKEGKKGRKGIQLRTLRKKYKKFRKSKKYKQMSVSNPIGHIRHHNQYDFYDYDSPNYNAEDEDIDDDYAIVNPDKKSASQKKHEKTLKKPMWTDLFKDRFDFLIVDEAHNFGNHTAQKTISLNRFDVPEKLFLTGTPIKNKVNKFNTLLTMLWGKFNTFNPFTDAKYRKTFVTSQKNPKIKNPELFQQLVRDKILRRTKFEPEVAKDVKFPRPEITQVICPINHEEKVYYHQWFQEADRLHSERKRANVEILQIQEEMDEARWKYKTVEDWENSDEYEFFEKEIKRRKLVKSLAPAMIDKLRLVAIYPQHNPLEHIDDEHASGFAYWIKESAESFISKEGYQGGITIRQQMVIDTLVERCRKGQKVFTVVKHPAVNYFFKEELEKFGVVRAEIIDGKVLIGNRQKIIDDFRSGKINCLLVTIGTFDVGINIPHADYCGIIEPDWNWSDMAQSFSRMIRPQSKGSKEVEIFSLEYSIENYVRQSYVSKMINTEYVIDFVTIEGDHKFVKWEDTEMLEVIFKDLKRGNLEPPEILTTEAVKERLDKGMVS